MSAPPIPMTFTGESFQPLTEGSQAALERWATVPSHPAYSVSTLGRLRRDAPTHGGGGSRRLPSGFLRVRPLPRGHLQVTLSMNNQPHTALVHRLVAEAFLPPPQEGQDCVCHRDDNPANNRPENLFWGTRADNTNDMVRKGRQASGERVTSSKLTADQVIEIRQRCAAGENQYELAAAFDVTQSNISMIASRSTWKHVR